MNQSTAQHPSFITPPSWTKQLRIEDYFDTDAPLHLDLGCGKGRFLVARAKSLPQVNFMGVDRMLGRLRIVDKKITREQLTNVRLIRLEASYVVSYCLPPNSVSVCYTFFPDPWPKKRHHKRRLFNQDFLASLHTVLSADGVIHVATDHDDYFHEISGLFENDPGFESTVPFEPSDEEETNFGQLFQSKDHHINRCSYAKKAEQLRTD